MGYNVQTAVDAKHHIIVAHEITNAGHDRDQLAEGLFDKRDYVYDAKNDEYRRIASWEHEDILDVVQQQLGGAPEAMKLGRRTVEHVFGTLRSWMGSSHYLTRTLPRV